MNLTRSEMGGPGLEMEPSNPVMEAQRSEMTLPELEMDAPKPEMDEAFPNGTLPRTKLVDAKHGLDDALPRTNAPAMRGGSGRSCSTTSAATPRSDRRLLRRHALHLALPSAVE